MKAPFSALSSSPVSNLPGSGESGQLKTFYSPEQTRWALYWLSDSSGQSRMLGFFDQEDALQRWEERFLQQPETTPRLPLEEQLSQLLLHTGTTLLPAFTGVFGTAFSGYLLKEDIESHGELLMLFYTADYRSELLGVFPPAEALEKMTLHYDARRQRCLLC